MSSYDSGKFGALTRHYTISSACGPQSDGVKGKKKKLGRQQAPTHNSLFFSTLGIRSKISPEEADAHPHALVFMSM